MDLIVRGEPHEVEFVQRLCRDKVRRGVLVLIPASDPVSDVAELKKERDEISRQVDELSVRLTCLKERIASMPVPNNIEPDNKESVSMDDKYLDIEDIQEIDLDEDNKTVVSDDSKSIQSVDSKEELSGRKSSRRSKKSE